jgi:hypothetical protein
MTHETFQVRAKQSFYHDLVGTKAQGEVFTVGDQTTLQALEQSGYVENLQNEANPEFAMAQQDAKKRQDEMGQAQAQANEAVSQATHNQNIQANQHTQQINQEAQQRTQQKPMESQRATAKKANEKE